MNQNTPELHTERLILRRFTVEDAAAFFAIMSDHETNTFVPWFPPETQEEASTWLRDSYLADYEKPTGFHYAICLKTDNIPIGYLNVSEQESRDFGYGLRSDFWHQGIATEAAAAVVELLKKVGIPYITATHDVNNPRSGGVMKHIGMTYCYSYEEQWQPKNFPVIFRMYQLNFDGQESRIYRKYWNESAVHFVEENI